MDISTTPRRDPDALWVCDNCHEELLNDFAQCQDGCTQPLDHEGACHPREFRGTECQRCDRPDRLTRVELVNIP